MKFLVFISTILCASTVAKDNRRRNPGPFFVASRGSTQGIRRLQGDGITSEVPDVDFTLNFDTSSTGGVCSTGCEGGYEEIKVAVKNLMENQELQYEFFFKVKGRFAVGAGIISDNFVVRVNEMIDSNPQVDTLILVNVPGSANDTVNLIGSKLIYEKGLSTCVPSDGLVASGGTDLFVSGFNRYATEGAKIGIHSWAAGDDLVGSDLPRDNPEHKSYLDFYKAVCIPGDFYWETLSHGVEPMYYVTEEEINSKFKYFRDCNGECELPTSGPISSAPRPVSTVLKIAMSFVVAVSSVLL